MFVFMKVTYQTRKRLKLTIYGVVRLKNNANNSTNNNKAYVDHYKSALVSLWTLHINPQSDITDKAKYMYLDIVVFMKWWFSDCLTTFAYLFLN